MSKKQDIDFEAIGLSLRYQMEENGLTVEDLVRDGSGYKANLIALLYGRNIHEGAIRQLLYTAKCTTIEAYIAKGEKAAQKLQYIDKFGDVLKKWRTKNRYTIADIEDKEKFGIPKVAALESGEKISARTVFTYLDKLGFGSMQAFMKAANYNLAAVEKVRKSLSQRIEERRAAGGKDDDLLVGR